MAYKTKYTPENPSKYIGNINSILCRSLWERKFCKYLDNNKNVIRWSFEGLKIPYLSPIDNKIHNYIPDFLIEMKTKSGEIETMIVEIKPKKQTKEPEPGRKKKKTLMEETMIYKVNEAKWKSASDFCKNNDIKFKILTEEDLF
jgi:hypothetical protein